MDEPGHSSCDGINLTTVSGDCFIASSDYTTKLFSFHLLGQFSAGLCIAPYRFRDTPRPGFGQAIGT
jgi:hypothetical protein